MSSGGQIICLQLNNFELHPWYDRTWARAERFVLAGGSYGGFVALEYALAYPKRLLGLILRDTSPEGPACYEGALKAVLSSPKVHVDRDRQVRLWTGKLIDNDDFQQGFAEILPIFSGPNLEQKQPTAREISNDMILHYQTHNAAFSVNLPKYNITLQLGKIGVPTLVVAGRHDVVAPVALAKIIAKGIPGAQLAIFEKSGHSPPADEPGAFRACVLQFLEARVLG